MSIRDRKDPSDPCAYGIDQASIARNDVYGPKKSKYTLEGQCLHAKVLGFVHPRTGEYMEFEVPLPEYFEKLLNKLDN